MLFAHQKNRNGLFPPPSSLRIVILLWVLFSGCAFIPEQNQLVTATRGTPLSRSQGECTQTISAPQPTAAQLPGLSPDHISVFDWNMYKGQNADWEVDFLRLSHAKDIILLQEAPLNKNLRDVLQKNNLYWNLNSAFKYKGVETGVLVASKIKPVASCGLRQTEPIIGLPKTILINRYIITESTEDLLVANIHGINISLGTGAYQEQFDALLNILDKHAGPIILAGDFNNWSDKRTVIMTRLMENLSLQALTLDGEARTTFFGDPVDHILYRGLQPVSYGVHPVTSSDHNPISVTFRLIPTQPGTDLTTW